MSKLLVFLFAFFAKYGGVYRAPAQKILITLIEARLKQKVALPQVIISLLRQSNYLIFSDNEGINRAH